MLPLSPSLDSDFIAVPCCYVPYQPGKEKSRIFVDLKNSIKETIWAGWIWASTEIRRKTEECWCNQRKKSVETFSTSKYLMIEKHWSSEAVALASHRFWNASKHGNIKPENNKPLEANVDVFFNIHFNFQVKLQLRMCWEKRMSMLLRLFGAMKGPSIFRIKTRGRANDR